MLNTEILSIHEETKLPDGQFLRVQVTREFMDFRDQSGEFPPVTGYGVEITTTPLPDEEMRGASGAWAESFGSLAELNAFLKGLSAGATMVGYVMIRLPLLPCV